MRRLYRGGRRRAAVGLAVRIGTSDAPICVVVAKRDDDIAPTQRPPILSDHPGSQRLVNLKDVAEQTGLVFAPLLNNDVSKAATTRQLEAADAIYGL